ATRICVRKRGEVRGIAHEEDISPARADRGSVLCRWEIAARISGHRDAHERYVWVRIAGCVGNTRSENAHAEKECCHPKRHLRPSRFALDAAPGLTARPCGTIRIPMLRVAYTTPSRSLPGTFALRLRHGIAASLP